MNVKASNLSETVDLFGVKRKIYSHEMEMERNGSGLGRKLEAKVIDLVLMELLMLPYEMIK